MTRRKLEYTTVKIPKELATEIDELIEILKLGYRSRSEFAVDVIRNSVVSYRTELNLSPTQKLED